MTVKRGWFTAFTLLRAVVFYYFECFCGVGFPYVG
jgi:hypothetical protein